MLAIGIWSGLTIIAVVVLSRKLNGAFGQQPHDVAACLIAFFAMTLGVIANILFQLTKRTATNPASSIVAGVITLVPPIVLGVALLSSRSTTAVTFLVTLFVFGSAVVVVSGEKSMQMRPPTQMGTIRLLSHESDVASLGQTTSPEVSLDETVSQWMTRKALSTGDDRLEGAIKVRLDAGQRQANIHIPFSPPFSIPPQIDCDVLNDCPVRLKVRAVHPFGARIELRRSAATQTEETVEVGFRAVAAVGSTLNSA